ncbi:hypothetical protein ACLOJK_016238 [Asimina triloba]
MISYTMYGTPPEHGAPVWCSVVIFPNPATQDRRRTIQAPPICRPFFSDAGDTNPARDGQQPVPDPSPATASHVVRLLASDHSRSVAVRHQGTDEFHLPRSRAERSRCRSSSSSSIPASSNDRIPCEHPSAPSASITTSGDSSRRHDHDPFRRRSGLHDAPQLPLSYDGQRSDARPPSPHPPATI